MDAKFGGYGFVPAELEGAIVSSHYFLFEANEKRLRRGYLEVVSQLGIIQEQIKAKGSTNYSAVRPKDVLDWEIPLPSIERQVEIERLYEVTKGKVEAILTELTHQQTLLTRLRQSILQEAVQGQLTAQWRQANPRQEPASELLRRIQAEKAATGKKEKPLPPVKAEEMPFELPEGWVWCRYGDLCSLITSGSRGWKDFYSEKGALFIRAQNIKNDKLDLDAKAFVDLPEKTEGQRSIVKLKDILITITGSGVTGAAIVDKLEFEEAYVSQHIALTRLVFPEVSDWAFLNMISKNTGRGQLEKLSHGDKPGLNLVNINQVIVPLPPHPEQAAIVAQVERLLGLVGQLESEAAGQRVQAEGLLQAALREAMGA